MLQVARFKVGGRTRWGVVEGDGCVPLEGEYSTTGDLLTKGRDDIAAAKGEGGEGRVALADVELLSPITENQQVLCQGANYRQHMIEAGMDPDSKGFNMFFRKASSCLCGANDAIQKPAHVQLLDYEVELGLVMGRDITKPEAFAGEDLPDAVAALVVHNDVSARDVQVPQMQFYKGKSYRTFGPTGPYLTLVDDALRKGWRALRLESKVNGEIRQNDLAENMVFKPAVTLTEMTQLQSVRAGDLIATGTPAGVAMQLPPPWLVKLMQLVPENKKWPMFIRKQKKSGRYLEPGDLVECSIAADDGSVSLGKLSNRIQTIDAETR
jgi:2-keto-4-pentenoate hydratase/2-oxohepta-3-ene-1,7-dioic acid hydratase in catechol pathway